MQIEIKSLYDLSPRALFDFAQETDKRYGTDANAVVGNALLPTETIDDISYDALIKALAKATAAEARELKSGTHMLTKEGFDRLIGNIPKFGEEFPIEEDELATVSSC